VAALKAAPVIRAPKTAAAPKSILTEPAPTTNNERTVADVITPASSVEAPVATAATRTSETTTVASSSEPATGQTGGNLSLPPPMRLNYELRAKDKSGLEVGGSASIVWRHDGESYLMHWDFKPTIGRDRTLRSTGRITPSGLAPERFSDKSRNERATHFVRDGAEAGKIVFSNNRPDAPLPPLAQDRVSMMMQLPGLIAADVAAAKPGRVYTLNVAGVDALEAWQLKVEAEETMELAGKPSRSLKLVRELRREEDQLLELWLSSDLAWLPARIRITQPNGSVADQSWRETIAP
jgi:hypothetical protein